LSFDHIKQQNKLSAKLLQLWAYFDNQDIWFELLQEGASKGPEWLSQLTKDELSFNQAARLLCDHGLAEVDESSTEIGLESRGYSIHSCVHSWTVYVLNQVWDAETAGLALECVGLHVPDSNASSPWVTQQRLVQHVATCWSFVVNGLVGTDGIEWALHRFGCLYADQGKLAEAEEIYQRALRGKEKVWGADHTSTLDTVYSLGNLHKNQGKLAEAEEMYQRVLQGYKKALGLDNTPTPYTVNNGRTPLLWATQNGYEAVVKLLLATGKVQVDFKDKYGRTPLSWATQNGHEAVVKLLLATGKVEVDSKDATKY
jgi:ankyrin repeat protein